MLKKLHIFPLLTIVYLLASCAPPIIEAPPPIIKWPMPPERTRIQFVDYIIGSNDIVKINKNSAKRLIFGDNKELRLLKPTFPYYRDEILYLSDIVRIVAFDLKRNTFWTIGTGYFRNATGIAVTSDGTVYIGDSLSLSVSMYKPGTLKPVRITAMEMFRSVGGMDINEELGLLYVVDPKAHNIKVLNFEGELVFVIGYRGSGNGEFNYPFDVKVGPGGRLYVSDSGNFRVQILDPDGNFLGRFGSLGTGYGNFSRPKGLALDPDGNIYVLDSAFGNFQIFNPRGQLLLSIGTTGNDPGMHILPIGIFIGKDGRIFITEHGNRRVQIYQYFSYDDEEKVPPPPLRYDLTDQKEQRIGSPR